jgi:ATP-dependent exoDNAse (exonuclease V) beta subunit
MDVVYRKGEKWFIIDYKTNLDPDELDEKYKEQLSAYKAAFFELTGNKAETLIYHIEV